MIYDENESLSLLKECIKELKMEEDVQIREMKSVISKYKNQGIVARDMMRKADTGYDKTA